MAGEAGAGTDVSGLALTAALVLAEAAQVARRNVAPLREIVDGCSCWRSATGSPLAPEPAGRSTATEGSRKSDRPEGRLRSQLAEPPAAGDQGLRGILKMKQRPTTPVGVIEHLRFALALLAVATAGLLTVASPASSASRSLPRLLGDGPHLLLTWQVKPTQISYTGDGTGVLGGFDGTGANHPGHLYWSSWTSAQGKGSGLVWLNDCEPDCADGSFEGTPVTVTASAPVGGHFTRLKMQFTIHGKRYTDVRVAAKRGRYWIYDLP